MLIYRELRILLPPVMPGGKYVTLCMVETWQKRPPFFSFQKKSLTLKESGNYRSGRDQHIREQQENRKEYGSPIFPYAGAYAGGTVHLPRGAA